VSGHVLIIDAMSNRRIRLRAHLDTAAYAVDLAETQTDGLLRIAQDVPDVVIVADDLPGLRLRHFCKLLRANPRTQLTTIIVAVPRENHSARVSALNAGAHDVIDDQCDPADLKARLRNFMRIRQNVEDRPITAGRDLAHGLAEPAAAFLPKTVATFVSFGALPDMQARIAALPDGFGIDARTVPAATTRRQPDPTTDVYVLFETGHGPEARDLLGALLTHPASRHSRILFVTDSLVRTASPLDLGAHDQAPLSVTGPELAVRLQRLGRRKHDADRARKATTELGEKAYTDTLTGLNNRLAIREYLQKTDRCLADHPRQMAILMVDIDHFKAVNDNHGHAAGDVVLAQVAAVLKASLREGDFLGRFGGEEFLIVLPDVGAGQARSVAQRLRSTVAASSTAVDDGTHVRVTISIGLALASRSDRKSTQDLLRAADNALYGAKHEGRNRINIATRDDDARVAARAVNSAS